MTRLDGEKKSPLPWIIGLLVLALLAAAIYYFTANKAPNAADSNGVAIQGPPPGTFGDVNSTDANMTDANMADANAIDTNSADFNSMDLNAVDANAMDSNMADLNAVAGAGAMNDSNAMDSNSAMMSNSATMDSNSAMTDNSAANMAMPSATPVAGAAKSDANGVVASRSKTIETKDAIVTYKKSIKEDGSLMRDKKIVPKPVEQAKKIQ